MLLAVKEGEIWPSHHALGRIGTKRIILIFFLKELTTKTWLGCTPC